MANKDVVAKKKIMPKVDAGAKLEAIAEKVESVETQANFGFRNIPLNEICYSAKNFFEMRDIEKLAKSIEKHGQQQNAVVCEIDHPDFKYELITGERRHRALSLLYSQTGDEKYAYIYCKVEKVADELDKEEKLIVTNVETRDLSDMERSKAATRLTEIVNERRANGENFDGKKTREVVAEMMSKGGQEVSPATVQKLQGLQKLIPEFQKQVDNGILGIEKATQFAQMTEEQQRLVLEMSQDLTTAEAKKIKDEFLKKDASNLLALKKVQDELDKEREENQKNKEIADEATSKIKALEREKGEVERQLSETKGALEEYQQTSKDEQQDIEELKETLKKQIEEEISKELGEQNSETIKTLQDDLAKADQREKELQEEMDARVKELQDAVKDAESKLAEKTKEKDIVEGNKAIISLAKQARQAMNVLLDEIALYKSKEGFVLDEETKEIIKEVTKYASEVVKTK